MNCTGAGGNASASTTITVTSSSTDSDGDGLTDSWELTYYPSLTAVNGSSDTDGDGLTSVQEQAYGTNPTLADSDGDGSSDGQEVMYGSDPTLATDTPANHRPAAPSILAITSPVPLIGYVFDVVGFIDPDNGALAASQWQIASDSQFTNLILDRTLPGRTELEAALGVLKLGASYQVRTRHEDSTGLWSDWSSVKAFTMAGSDANDTDGNGIDDRYQVTGAVDTNGNSLDDSKEGMCNLKDISGSQVLGFQASSGTVRCTSVMNESELPPGSTSADFPFGVFSFGVDGLQVNALNPATVDISIYFPQALPAGTRWYKYDPSTRQVTDFTSHITISGTRVVLHLTDGGVGDADGVVNGRITDPSGPVAFLSGTPTSSSSGGGGGGAFELEALLGLLSMILLLGRGRQQRIYETA